VGTFQNFFTRANHETTLVYHHVVLSSAPPAPYRRLVNILLPHSCTPREASFPKPFNPRVVEKPRQRFAPRRQLTTSPKMRNIVVLGGSSHPQLTEYGASFLPKVVTTAHYATGPSAITSAYPRPRCFSISSRAAKLASRLKRVFEGRMSSSSSLAVVKVRKPHPSLLQLQSDAIEHCLQGLR
jgi:hypothetical protein